jgi:hypothetical protein
VDFNLKGDYGDACDIECPKCKEIFYNSPNDNVIADELTGILIAKCPKCGFCKPYKEKFKRILSQVWDEIGSDALQMTAECKGLTGNKAMQVTMSRSEVIEMVLDASRPEMHMTENEKQIWRRIDYKVREKLAKETFTFKRYGM